MTDIFESHALRRAVGGVTNLSEKSCIMRIQLTLKTKRHVQSLLHP